MQKSSWIKFVPRDTPDGVKTKRWFVFTNDNTEHLLGGVSWFPRWRKYVFSPLALIQKSEPIPISYFEEDCLRDIANFIEEETKKHRKSWKER